MVAEFPLQAACLRKKCNPWSAQTLPQRFQAQIRAEVLLKIGREFAKSIEWPLTGEQHKSNREEE
jgi:hypothetical protein